MVSQTGQGVVVGVIDTGIDFRHLDFTVPGSGGRQTRIKAMLDMTVYGTQHLTLVGTIRCQGRQPRSAISIPRQISTLHCKHQNLPTRMETQ